MNNIDPVALTFLDWLRAQPFLLLFMTLQFLDILSGLSVAFVAKQLDSAISLKGMNRKIQMWLVIGVAFSLEQLAGGTIPLTKITCAFYAFVEGLSILENAGKAGLPVPTVILEALRRVKQATESDPAPAVNVQEVSFMHVQQAGLSSEDLGMKREGARKISQARQPKGKGEEAPADPGP